MHPSRHVLFAALAACAFLALPIPATAWQTDPWRPSAPMAPPGERGPGKRGAPDASPPARTQPRTHLAPLADALRGSIRRVDTHGEKLVAFTFDLCELSDQRAGFDGAIVDVLRANGARATFFAGGKWMRSHPGRTMQLMADPAFELGSHAWTHGNFGVLPEPRMAEQILWTQAQYELLREELAHAAPEQGTPERATPGQATPGQVTPEHGGAGRLARVPEAIRTFRFPYGRCREQALDMLAGHGIAAVQWDVNMMDAAPGRTAQAISAHVLKNVRPGSIVLGHANGFGHNTAQALAVILPALAAAGYRTVTVSELLAAGTPQSARQCYDSRPGDTRQYDAIFGDGTVHPPRK